MVTTKEIASELQLSISTVGRALADDPRISAATKQKVAAVASRLGYVGNRAARMMRGAPSTLVGLVLPDIRNHFYSTIAHALSKCLEAENYQLMLSESDDDRMLEMRHIRELVSVNVAGIIIVPTPNPHPDSVRLLSKTAHLQLLRNQPLFGSQCFGIDDVQAFHDATTHLLKLGHERIAYIGGTGELSTGAARRQGFRNALQGTPAATLATEIVGAPSSPQVGQDALKQLLAMKEPPTAVVLGSVQITQGFLDEVIAQGIRVPEQMSVIGFGDEPGCRWWSGGLTSIALPVSGLATASGLWFMHQLRQKEMSTQPYSSMSHASLIIRGSTSAPQHGSKK